MLAWPGGHRARALPCWSKSPDLDVRLTTTNDFVPCQDAHCDWRHGLKLLEGCTPHGAATGRPGERETTCFFIVTQVPILGQVEGKRIKSIEASCWEFAYVAGTTRKSLEGDSEQVHTSNKASPGRC